MFELTQQEQEWLDALGGGISAVQFDVGDWVAGVKRSERAKGVHARELYVAAADRIGSAPDTVRAWAEVCDAFPRARRAQVDPGGVMSFYAWRVVKPAGDRAYELIRKAVESADEYNGRPAPVRVIQRWVAQHAQREVQWDEHALRAVHQLDEAMRKAAGDGIAGGVVQTFAQAREEIAAVLRKRGMAVKTSEAALEAERV